MAESVDPEWAKGVLHHAALVTADRRGRRVLYCRTALGDNLAGTSRELDDTSSAVRPSTP